jgi:hypothetical protein
MSDNLALKLLVAGIIGAVVGAAAAERYHFPTGLVYGGLNRARPYERIAIDPMMGSGRVVTVEPRPDDGGRRDVYGAPPVEDGGSTPYNYRAAPEPRYYYYRRPTPRAAPARSALCYREVENWNFAPSGRYYRCPPGSANRVYRPSRDDG